jgi:CxxC motif-containing protein (DUF1111 family)
MPRGWCWSCRRSAPAVAILADMRPFAGRRWAAVGSRARCVAGSVILIVGALGMAYGSTFAGARAGPLSSPTVVLDAYFDGDGAGEPLTERGRELFQTDFTPEQGLGPLFNARSCLACHSAPISGGGGPDGLGTVVRVGTLREGLFDPLLGRGGPIARAHSVRELGSACAPGAGAPAAANMTSVRTAPALFGLGLVDAIPDAVILEGVVPRGDGIRGRPALTREVDGHQRVGRFGWKAETPTLGQFVAEAFRNELGITNPRAPVDLIGTTVEAAPGCPGVSAEPEDDGTMPAAVTAYIAALAPPARARIAGMESGAALFDAIGCAACHTPELRADGRTVPLYSDLLLHDMGPALDDRVVQGPARGPDWRTTPLWGLGQRQRFLHDGRARTLEAAILAHAGEAEAVIGRFRAMESERRAELLAFLASL